MAIPISYLAGVKLLISKQFLDQVLVDSMMIFNHQLPNIATSNIEPISFQCSASGLTLTNDLSELNSDDQVVFYHSVKGFIFAYQRYEWDWISGKRLPMFSTMQFVENLKRAEDSPNVLSHFLHINSGGGEGWMLDVAVAAMKKCKKPIYVFIEGCCCSAAYYIAANAQVIKAFTQNDIVGSIGTMSSFIDVSRMLERIGIKEYDIYASRSDLKNKIVRDVFEGNPDQYIKTILDPVQSQFETSVKLSRKQLSELDNDHPVFRGEIYTASEAIKVGLIDGVISDFNQALYEAFQLGQDIKANNSLLTKL